MKYYFFPFSLSLSLSLFHSLHFSILSKEMILNRNNANCAYTARIGIHGMHSYRLNDRKILLFATRSQVFDFWFVLSIYKNLLLFSSLFLFRFLQKCPIIMDCFCANTMIAINFTYRRPPMMMECILMDQTI